jgi:hypothetical protein
VVPTIVVVVVVVVVPVPLSQVVLEEVVVQAVPEAEVRVMAAAEEALVALPAEPVAELLVVQAVEAEVLAQEALLPLAATPWCSTWMAMVSKPPARTMAP